VNANVSIGRSIVHHERDRLVASPAPSCGGCACAGRARTACGAAPGDDRVLVVVGRIGESPMIGRVHFVKLLTGPRAIEAAYAIIVADGRRFFGPPTECPQELARGDRVEFDPDVHADPRGPIACRVRVLERAVSTPPETWLTDTILSCTACGASFTWTAGEQVFFRSRNFVPPRRCRPCRRRGRET
jgi:hypothetical protein